MAENWNDIVALGAVKAVIEAGGRACWSRVNDEPPCRHSQRCPCADDRARATAVLDRIVLAPPVPDGSKQ